MKKILLMMVGMMFSASILASNVSGQITQLLVHTKGGTNGADSDVVIMFRIGSPGSSTCPSGEGVGDWAFSGSNDLGKSMYSMLLSAAAQGKPVTVIGTGLCDAWAGTRERPNFIYVNY